MINKIHLWVRIGLITLIGGILISGCGEAPSEIPGPVLDAGSIAVSGSISISATEQIIPDSIGIILNNEDLGFYSNSALLSNILTGNYRISTYFQVRDQIVRSSNHNLEVKFAETSTVEFSINTGRIYITGQIETAPGVNTEPDSIGIILDGDNLGYRSNPVTLELIPVGTHSLSTYCRINGKDYLGPAVTTEVELGVETTKDFSLLAGGVIQITALFQDFPVDDFGVTVDGDTIGVITNQQAIPNIDAGTHKITLWSRQDDANLGAWQKGLEVALGETTFVSLDLIEVASTRNSHIPDFACEDIDGAKHALSDHWGEVIYLYFFDNT